MSSCRRADQADRELVDHALEIFVARGVLLAHLREHHDPFGSARRVRGAEHRDAAAPHARQIADRLLQLVRADVASAADDDVFFAPGEEQRAFGQVGAVAGVDPLAGEQRLRRLGIAVVARGGRRAAELQQAFLPVGQLQARAVDDAEVVARDRRAAADDDERRRIVRRQRTRLPPCARNERDRGGRRARTCPVS
jgi:hypothetical protein